MTGTEDIDIPAGWTVPQNGLGLPDGIHLRDAAPADYDAVVAFTTDTWGEGTDYIPDIYHDWIQGEHRLTLVADAGDAIAGIAQAVMLSSTEGWAQGMRVNPAFRGQQVGTALTEALFEWCRACGATVVRNMVFAWNAAGLGHSRALGFDPVTEFRWLQPDPDPDRSLVTAGTPAGDSGTPGADAAGDSGEQLSVGADVDAAWRFWTDCDAADHLAGLAIDMDESWALRELTPQMVRRAATETALFCVTDGDGECRGVSYRTRTYEREVEDEQTEGDDTTRTERGCEYGVGAWSDLAAADTLLTAIAADAADCDADQTRILVPETARTVSDGAYLRAAISDHPDFVLARAVA